MIQRHVYVLACPLPTPILAASLPRAPSPLPRRVRCMGSCGGRCPVGHCLCQAAPDGDSLAWEKACHLPAAQGPPCSRLTCPPPSPVSFSKAGSPSLFMCPARSAEAGRLNVLTLPHQKQVTFFFFFFFKILFVRESVGVSTGRSRGRGPSRPCDQCRP